MIGISSAYLSGLFFASFFIDRYGFILLIPVSVIIIAVAKVRKFSRFDLYAIVFSFLTALTVNLVYTVNYYLPATEFESTTGNFSGKVIDYEVYDGDKASYIVDGRINGGLRTKIIFYCNETGAEYGDIITLKNCDFLEIENDYLFNSKDYYKSRHIFLRVYSAETVDVEYTNSAKIQKFIADFRERTINNMRFIIGDETGGFLAGMIFGEKQYLDDSTKTALYRSGIGHILTVSGLHVSIIASLIMMIMKKFKVNKFISFGIINLLFLFLIALANYRISAVRATIMLDIMYSARLFRRQSDALNSIAVATFFISLADPYAVYNSGFLLSISGTFGVAVFGNFMAEKVKNKLAKSFIISVCTSVSVMPLSLYYYEETSLISSLANVLLVPLCTCALVFGLLYIITGVGFLLYMADIFIKPVIFISNLISSVEFLHIPRMDGIFPVLLMLAGIITVCLYLYKANRRIVCISIAVSLFVFSFSAEISGKMREYNVIVAVLGRNNNAVAVISHKGTTNIIDLNGHYRSAEYVSKYLAVNGLSADTLILTENVASQDIVYETELQSFSVSRRFAVKSNEIYDRFELLNESGFTLDTGVYTISYNEDMMSVCYGDCEVNFSQAKENIHTGGLAVYYGNITKKTNVYDDSIYLENMNNFEIILSSNGKYIIRRLYG